MRACLFAILLLSPACGDDASSPPDALADAGRDASEDAPIVDGAADGSAADASATICGGFVCNAGQSCIAGHCTCPAGSPCQCPSGTTQCDQTCFDTQTEPENCGYCGHVCAYNANSYPVCSQGQCTSECNPGFADCDGNAGNGCEADLAGDGSNCGSCGHDCLGGACQQRLCRPVTLATAFGDVYGVTVDAEGVYFTVGGPNATDAGIMKLTVGAQLPTFLLSDRNAVAIHAQNGLLYYSSLVTNCSCGIINVIPNTGGTPTTLVNLGPQTLNVGFLVDDSGFYIAEGYQLFTAPLAGGNANVLFTEPYFFTYAIDASNVYWWSNGSTLESIPKAGGQRTAIATDANALGLAVRDGTVYWANTSDRAIHMVPTGGGTPSVLVTESGGIGPMAADASGVYWMVAQSQGGETLRSAAADGTIRTIATDLGSPISLVLDANAVYFTTGGAILKVAK